MKAELIAILNTLAGEIEAGQHALIANPLNYATWYAARANAIVDAGEAIEALYASVPAVLEVP